MAAIGTDIQHAATLLRQGEIVGIPTETVYGLAAHALIPDAVAKIFEAKNRPFFDPLIVHVSAADDVLRYVTDFPEKARTLAAMFWPGPLTLLLPRNSLIPDLVTSGLATVGVRCPRHTLLQELLGELDFPLAAPSANPFGYISPTTTAHVQAQLGHLIPYILDGGPCAVGIESTIVGFENGVTIHRLGGITREEIEHVLGPVQVVAHQQHYPLAPGQLDSHYSPRKQLVIGAIPDLQKRYAHLPVAILSYQTDYEVAHQVILSRSGNLREAAQRLFAALRELDDSQAQVILAEPVPDVGLGRAINDRLRRAAA